MRIRDRSRVAVGVVVLGLVGATGCSQARPTLEEWVPVWEHAVANLPTEEALSAGDTQGICEEALADMRIHQGALHPTPDEAIDETVTLWVEIAESIFFECPPDDGFSAGFAELRRLEAEVEVVLAMDQAG